MHKQTNSAWWEESVGPSHSELSQYLMCKHDATSGLKYSLFLKGIFYWIIVLPKYLGNKLVMSMMYRLGKQCSEFVQI